MTAASETIKLVSIGIAAVTGKFAGITLALVANAPDWATPVFGNLGALALAVVCIKYLTSKLEKQERKYDKNMETMVSLIVQNQTVITQAGDVIQKSTHALEKCAKCEIKHLLLNQKKSSE